MKYAYRNAHLLDGTRDMLPRDGLAVLTDGETIVGIVPEEAIPEGFEPVDLGGKYLMPGLINLHVHLAGNGKPQKKRRDNEKLVRRAIRIVATAAHTDEDEARSALEQCGFSAKTAIVMLVKHLPAAEAERRLEETGGIVARALDEEE